MKLASTAQYITGVLRRIPHRCSWAYSRCRRGLITDYWLLPSIRLGVGGNGPPSEKAQEDCSPEASNKTHKLFLIIWRIHICQRWSNTW